jgi:hypothetical protein
LDKDGSWYQRLGRVVCDAAVPLLNIQCQSYGRHTKRGVRASDSTAKYLGGAWTAGGNDAPKTIKMIHPPQQLPIPDYTLKDWQIRIQELELARPGSPPEFKSFVAIDNLSETEAFSPWEDGVPDFHLEYAAEEERQMHDRILSEIENQVPSVCHFKLN